MHGLHSLHSFCNVVRFRWNYDLSNPIMKYENPRVDYTFNLHPDIPTIGKMHSK